MEMSLAQITFHVASIHGLRDAIDLVLVRSWTFFMARLSPFQKPWNAIAIP